MTNRSEQYVVEEQIEDGSWQLLRRYSTLPPARTERDWSRATRPRQIVKETREVIE